MPTGSRVGAHFLSSVLRMLEPRTDDDFVDRLHYLYTPILLLMFALLASAKNYAGHPIECFVPAYFTRAMEQYSENYCYVQNTYWVPFDEHIPHRLDEREKRQIGYYQWVSFVLAISALMFHLPALCWRMLSNQSGLQVSVVLGVACQEENVDPEVRDRTIDVIARHIDDALRYQRDLIARSRGVFLFALINVGRIYGAYLGCRHFGLKRLVYSTCKLLHLLNALVQFYFLNKFLETSDYPLFGGHVLYDLFRDREWQDSGRFPRVTLCDFEIRVLGNVHRHTVQCVLVINMFLEKIFVFLWLWFLFLSFLSIINVSAWLATVAVPVCRQAFVLKYLDACPEETRASADVHLFCEKFLRTDGIFLLKMVSAHAGNIMCARLCETLWVLFQQWRTSTKVMTGSARKESTGSMAMAAEDSTKPSLGIARLRKSSGERRAPSRESSGLMLATTPLGGAGLTTTSFADMRPHFV
uniref:Innexin n=1 Tax=Globodera pallida TaxID=36090 RepID=A0A183CEJ6_GLOPA